MAHKPSQSPETAEQPGSRLTCAQCERMVQDALDGALGPDDQAQFDHHQISCPACIRELVDAQRGAAWMEMLKAVPPEPPPTLVAAILQQTSGNPATALPVLRAETLLQPASRAYAGAVLPFHARSAYPVWARLPFMAQPRFAMTAAMAFFSVALTMNLTGVHLSDLHPSELRPSAVRRTFWGANARAVRYYDNLRVVYELQSRVRELQRENNTGGGSAPPDPAPAASEGKPAAPEPVAPTHNAPGAKKHPSQTGDPRSSNPPLHPAPESQGRSRPEGKRSGATVHLATYRQPQHNSASRGTGARA